MMPFGERPLTRLNTADSDLGYGRPEDDDDGEVEEEEPEEEPTETTPLNRRLTKSNGGSRVPSERLESQSAFVLPEERLWYVLNPLLKRPL